MSTSVFDGEELKKIGEQLSQSAISIANHLGQLGGTSNSIDAQKTYDKVKSFVTKGVADVRTDVPARYRIVFSYRCVVVRVLVVVGNRGVEIEGHRS